MIAIFAIRPDILLVEVNIALGVLCRYAAWTHSHKALRKIFRAQFVLAEEARHQLKVSRDSISHLVSAELLESLAPDINAWIRRHVADMVHPRPPESACIVAPRLGLVALFHKTDIRLDGVNRRGMRRTRGRRHRTRDNPNEASWWKQMGYVFTLRPSP